jgi:hypothetical protein
MRMRTGTIGQHHDMHVMAARMMLCDQPTTGEAFIVGMGCKHQQWFLTQDSSRILDWQITQGLQHSAHTHHRLKIAPDPSRQMQHHSLFPASIAHRHRVQYHPVPFRWIPIR